MSRAALARRFNELVGEPPMTFLTGWRIALAADLLREPGATIGSVADQVGYGSPFALSAAFKRVRGVSPHEHRAHRRRRIAPWTSPRWACRSRSARARRSCCDFDVVGQAFGLITQPHVHTRQTERYEILEGAMRLVTPTADIHLSEGDTYELPAGVPHSQIPASDHARIRVQVRPRANSEALFQRFAELSAAGEFNRWGFPKPKATARLVLDFGDDNRAAQPPVRRATRAGRAIAR